MPEEVGGERTLPASPLKRQRARERGHVAKSLDLNAAWMLFVSLIAMWLLARNMLDDLVGATQFYLGYAGTLPASLESVPKLTLDGVLILAKILVPFMLLLLAGGLAINIMQVGILVAPSVIVPKPERFNPVTGFKKFFTLRSFVELAKSIVKLVVIGLVVYLTLRGRWEQVMILGRLSPPALVKTASELIVVLWFRVALAMLVLGLLDYGFQRWHYEQDLRMTAQEAREELKELEGDPRIRQRVRQIQRQLAMQRMMAEVPKAEVVVTNPVKYAVALRYDIDKMDAPIVTAKGARLLAERIREIAIEHNVPIVEKPDLARMLYRTVELYQPIPESLYRAVAEVLQFVYEIDKRAEKVREREAFMASLRKAAA